MKKKLKVIENTLKKDKIWKQYQVKFKHPQMRLLISRIALIFNSKISLKSLVNLEKTLTFTVNSPNMFDNSFINFNEILNTNYDWNAFAKFIWYIFQTSTFYDDLKHQIPNTFNRNNYLKQNEIKRQYYYQWLKSINPNQPKVNALIKQVLKAVF